METGKLMNRFIRFFARTRCAARRLLAPMESLLRLLLPGDFFWTMYKRKLKCKR